MKGNYENKLAASVSEYKTVTKENDKTPDEVSDKTLKRVKDEVKPSDASVSSSVGTKRKGHGLVRLQNKSEIKSEHVSYVLTAVAVDNIKKYAKEYNYKSANAFVNDLFEHLPDYLD